MGSGPSSSLKRIGNEWVSLFAGRPDYYVISSPSPILRAVQSPVVKFIRQSCSIRGNEEVLEAGCGSGLFGLALATLGCMVTAVDLSDQMVTNVQDAATMMANAGYRIQVTANQQDITALALGDNTFDVAFNEGVIEHWVRREERIQVLREMVRVVKPGGRVVVCIPNNAHPWYPWWHLLQRTVRSRQLIFRPGGALEEAVISAGMLAADLKDAGLGEIATDGFAVTRTIAHYPRWLPLRIISRALERCLPPFSQKIRRSWGIYLLAYGIKPK